MSESLIEEIYKELKWRVSEGLTDWTISYLSKLLKKDMILSERLADHAAVLSLAYERENRRIVVDIVTVYGTNFTVIVAEADEGLKAWVRVRPMPVELVNAWELQPKFK